MTPTDPGTPALPPRPAGRYLTWVPLVAAAVASVYLASQVRRMNPPKTPYNIELAARIPVVEGGRVKPLESAARVYLRMVSGREEFVDEAGVRQPAIRWYLDLLAGGSPDHRGPIWKAKFIRIDNEQVLSEMGLKPVEGLRYSLDEIANKFDVLLTKSARARQKREADRPLDLFETKILELEHRVGLVVNLAAYRGLDAQKNKLLLLPPQADGGEWKSLSEYRNTALTESLLATMAEARKKLTDDRLGRLSPADEKAVIRELFEEDADRMKPQVRAEMAQEAVTILKLPPADVLESNRRKWLEAAFALLPDDHTALRASLQQDAQTRLAANPAAVAWDEMVAAYRDKKPDEFNSLVAAYHATYLDHVPADALTRTRVEAAYDRFAPFYHCTLLYVLVFVLAVLGFVLRAAELPGWGDALRLSASRVLYLTLIVHTSALLVRMYLMDREFVFVTNLYSSAIFIGWGCVVIGMVLERLFPIGVGNVIAAVLGVASGIVAHNLATEDTLEMMQAVLDTNFWLSTHVTTVTLGYTATLVAGFLGGVYVLQLLATVVRDGFREARPATFGSLLSFGAAAAGLVTIPLMLLWFLSAALSKFELVHSSIPSLLLFLTAAAGVVYAASLLLVRASADHVDVNGNPAAVAVPGVARPVAGMALTADGSKILGQMIYGVVCFATLLSFVGTVLGGIWADQSWGRFWGWDPKENGAVLIVLWNSLILHARWCGLVRDRGVAVLAVVGNMITAWSWFGTNQLGIGLHAYGFDTRLADGCANFWLSQLVVIAMGLIPQRFWASATRRAGRPAAAVPVEPVSPVDGVAAEPRYHNGTSQTTKAKKSRQRR